MNRDGRALRRRFVIAVVGVSFGVLVLSYLATYALVRRSAQNSAVSNLESRSQALADIMSDPAFSGRRPIVKLKAALKVTDISVVGVTPGGEFVDIPAAGGSSLPDSVKAADLLPQALLRGEQVTGRRGNTAFLAVPNQTLPNGNRVVVVATQTVDTSVLRKLFPLLLLA